MSNNNLKIPSLSHDSGDAYDAPNQTGSPERNLVLGVLERAILDYVGNDQAEMESASEWLFDDLEDNSTFTFAWVCEQLDLDKYSIQKMIKAMPKRGKHKIAPWYFQKHEGNQVALCA